MHDKLTYASIQDKGEGLPIIAAEDEETLNHMQKKAVGPDSIMLEETEALGDFSTELLTQKSIKKNSKLYL